ncbi:MAG: hypothetical protein OXB84_07360 [Halobacteriovoraceae bacterium]|nr:hypothetical protein [Halobacteriovoraceae bacterium]
MREVFYNFFIRFLHPLQVHEFISKSFRPGTLDVVDNLPAWPGRFNLKKTSFYEFLLISWIFVLVETIYSVSTLNIGLQISRLLKGTSFFMPYLSDQLVLIKILSLISILGGAVLFPFYALLYQKFWIHITGFFMDLYNMKRNDTAIEEVVNSSFVANIFLVIPIFGSFFRTVTSFVFLFAGFRRNLKMNIPQSVLILSTPFVLFLVFIFLAILWFMAVMF